MIGQKRESHWEKKMQVSPCKTHHAPEEGTRSMTAEHNQEDAFLDGRSLAYIERLRLTFLACPDNPWKEKQLSRSTKGPLCIPADSLLRL
jgi:hypothetical protein